MGAGVGIRQVGYFDCAGGGQVVVENNIAYVAHMRSPHGTSIIDVSDPKNPKELATLGMPQGAHSHKVRVGNDVMVVNHYFTKSCEDWEFKRGRGRGDSLVPYQEQVFADVAGAAVIEDTRAVRFVQRLRALLRT